MDSEPKTTFTIQEYLSKACLPPFRKSSSLEFTTARVRNALAWPVYEELQKAPGTRVLNRIIRSEGIAFITLLRQYFATVQAPKIDVRDFIGIECPLRLASPGHVQYEGADTIIFKRVDNEERYLVILEKYLLQTVSECLRVIKGIPPQSPEMTAFKFVRASHLCPAHHGRWDIMALPGTPQSPYPFLIFFVSPDQFGCLDMLDFVEPRKFQYTNANELDRPRKMIETLWAVINDTCEGRGRFFAVSNYIRWAFGELSPSGGAASITFSFESTLLKDDGIVSKPPDLGCNTLEMLVFWVDWALRRQLQAPALIA